MALALATLLTVLKQAGLALLYPLGEPFDPRYHEAVHLAEHAGVRAGMIVEVTQPGFVSGAVVLRAARVSVAG